MSYCSLRSLLMNIGDTPMTKEERRAQAISFAYGNMAMMSRYRDATEDELWDLRIMVTKLYNERENL